MTDVSAVPVNNFTASDRYVKVDIPLAMPGCCFFCRKTKVDFFIDMGMSTEHPAGIEMDGSVCICSECVDFVARLSGYEPIDDLSSLVQKHHEMAAELRRALITIEIQETAIHDLTNSGYNIPSDMVAHVNSLTSTVSSSGEEPPESPEQPVEQVDDERVAELPSPRDDDGLELKF